MKSSPEIPPEPAAKNQKDQPAQEQRDGPPPGLSALDDGGLSVREGRQLDSVAQPDCEPLAEHEKRNEGSVHEEREDAPAPPHEHNPNEGNKRGRQAQQTAKATGTSGVGSDAGVNRRGHLHGVEYTTASVNGRLKRAMDCTPFSVEIPATAAVEKRDVALRPVEWVVIARSQTTSRPRLSYRTVKGEPLRTSCSTQRGNRVGGTENRGNL